MSILDAMLTPAVILVRDGGEKTSDAIRVFTLTIELLKPLNIATITKNNEMCQLSTHSSKKTVIGSKYGDTSLP